MKKNASADLAVYVVWSSQLGAEEKHVEDAAELMPDPRARHYWDPGQLVGKDYQGFLSLPYPAWDVWMVFDRGAGWDNEPPEPVWWEHQLPELPRENRLDAKRFASKVAASLARDSATLSRSPSENE